MWLGLCKDEAEAVAEAEAEVSLTEQKGYSARAAFVRSAGRSCAIAGGSLEFLYPDIPGLISMEAFEWNVTSCVSLVVNILEFAVNFFSSTLLSFSTRKEMDEMQTAGVGLYALRTGGSRDKCNWVCASSALLALDDQTRTSCPDAPCISSIEGPASMFVRRN